MPNEFLLVLHDGEEFDSVLDTKLPPRAKGAYYKNIERKMLLKKKRANVRAIFLMSEFELLTVAQIYDQYEDKWEVIRLLHQSMSKEEEEEREEALAEVVDPMFLMARGDADAEGEVEMDDGGYANGVIDVLAES